MNEELTNEVLEAMKKCNTTNCEDCPANKTACIIRVRHSIEKLATALLEERAKPKVWDGAPDEADYVTVGAYKNEGPLVPIKVKCYHRELPKTRVRWLLENPDCPFKSCQFWDDNADGKCGGELHGGSAQESCLWYADYESALTKYAEELTKKETN